MKGRNLNIDISIFINENRISHTLTKSWTDPWRFLKHRFLDSVLRDAEAVGLK
jgi:hypothetical protein